MEWHMMQNAVGHYDEMPRVQRTGDGGDQQAVQVRETALHPGGQGGRRFLQAWFRQLKMQRPDAGADLGNQTRLSDFDLLASQHGHDDARPVPRILQDGCLRIECAPNLIERDRAWFRGKRIVLTCGELAQEP